MLVNDYREKAEEVFEERLQKRIETYERHDPDADVETWFTQAENDLMQQTDIERALSAYQVIIPPSEVVSVSYFDRVLYEAFEEASADRTAENTI